MPQPRRSLPQVRRLYHADAIVRVRRRTTTRSPLVSRLPAAGSRYPPPPRYPALVPHKRPLKTLERVISKAGLGSRVEARQWIAAGRVAVNRAVVRDPDHWVDMERD